MASTITGWLNKSFLYDQEVFEVFSIFVKTLVGLIFFLYDTIGVRSASAFGVLGQAFPLWIWGVITFAVAFFHAYTLVKSTWKIRKRAVLTGIVYWLFLFLLYLTTGASPIASALIFGLFLFLWWTYAKLARLEQVTEKKGAGSGSIV